MQNTVKGQRLKFDSLEAYPGEWIHATGTYTEASEPGLVKEAAKGAVHGVRFDVLIVRGFAFDPHVSEEAKRYGNLIYGLRRTGHQGPSRSRPPNGTWRYGEARPHGEGKVRSRPAGGTYTTSRPFPKPATD